MKYIKVNNVSKKYGKQTVLDNVCLEVNKGECVGIVGANGCGKTTLLSIIAGCHKCDKGSVVMEGVGTQKCSAYSLKTGYIPQDNPLMEQLSVRDNLRFYYCDSKRNLDKDISEGIIADFKINEYLDKPVSKLSGGQKKRVSIVCALAKEPELLIMDEPGASLDIICKEEIKRYINEYKKSGGTVIIASHEAAEIEIMDRVYLLENGRMRSVPQGMDIYGLVDMIMGIDNEKISDVIKTSN